MVSLIIGGNILWIRIGYDKSERRLKSRLFLWVLVFVDIPLTLILFYREWVAKGLEVHAIDAVEGGNFVCFSKGGVVEDGVDKVVYCATKGHDGLADVN